MNHPNYLLILTILASALAGCDSSQSGIASTAEDAHEHADAHAHASGGPHGGSMLELGEYHAELVHDDAAGTVTVYILDGAAAKVRCRSCYSDHDYRNEQVPPSKRDLKKAALFNAVLQGVAPPPEPPEKS